MEVKKRNIYKFFSIVSLAILASCGGSTSEDIKVKELKSICEFSDALNTCFTEIMAIRGDAESEADLSEEDQKKGRKIARKTQKIMKAALDEGFEQSDFEECPSFEKTKEMMEELGDW